jgi:hypothetical protein
VSIAPLLSAHTSVLFVLLDQHSTTAFRLPKAAQLGLAHARRPLFGAGCLATSLISPFPAQLSALDLSIVLGIRIASLHGVSSLGRRFGVGSVHFRSSGPVLFFPLSHNIMPDPLFTEAPTYSHGAEYVRLLRLANMGHTLRSASILAGFRRSQANTDHTPVRRKQQWGPHLGYPTGLKTPIPLRHINRRRPPGGHLMDGHLGGRAHTSPPTCTCRRRETKKWWQGRLGRFETATQTVGQRQRRVEVLTG